MAFNPSSTIYLCNVPFDNTYKNQIYFDSREDQNAYFTLHTKRSFSDYLTVRKTLPDGSMQSKIKVNANIDELYNINYMYYRNENHGTRVFYAFVNNLIYVNEGTTEIVFETDVWQTWMFDVDILPSFVVREHSETDEIGDNIVPESFTFQDYEYSIIRNEETLNDYGYLVITTEDTQIKSFLEEVFEDSEIKGYPHSGIFQGVYFFYYPKSVGVESINALLKVIYSKSDDPLISITVIPEFSVKSSFAEEEAKWGILSPSSVPATAIVDMSFPPDGVTLGKFGTYRPKNKKMYTSPFYNVAVTNHNGDELILNVEDFEDPTNISFTMYGDISTNPSILLAPNDYKGIGTNIDEGISISNFPQCASVSDTFKLWLSKNQFGTGFNLATGIANLATGIATAPTGFGAIQAVQGAAGILNTIDGVIKSTHAPNKANTGGGKNNLITAMGKQKFEYYVRKIKGEYAEIVDNFFTMYGYQCNKVKTPNLNKRPYFNYVETRNINIAGNKIGMIYDGIPNDDMRQLKAMFNGGVTLWKKNATIGDYSVNNSPVEEVNDG